MFYVYTNEIVKLITVERVYLIEPLKVTIKNYLKTYVYQFTKQK